MAAWVSEWNRKKIMKWIDEWMIKTHIRNTVNICSNSVFYQTKNFILASKPKSMCGDKRNISSSTESDIHFIKSTNNIESGKRWLRKYWSKLTCNKALPPIYGRFQCRFNFSSLLFIYFPHLTHSLSFTGECEVRPMSLDCTTNAQIESVWSGEKRMKRKLFILLSIGQLPSAFIIAIPVVLMPLR